MLVVCYGLPKSGSLFCFQLVRRIASIKWPQAPLIERIDAAHRGAFHGNLSAVLPHLLEVPEHYETLVVKTQGRFPEDLTDAVARGVARVIICAREPLEVAGCLLLAGELERQKPPADQVRYFADIESHQDALTKAIGLANNGRAWNHKLSGLNPLVVPFSALLAVPHSVTTTIAEYIGIRQVRPERIVNALLDAMSTELEASQRAGQQHHETFRNMDISDEGRSVLTAFRTRVLEPAERRFGIESEPVNASA